MLYAYCTSIAYQVVVDVPENYSLMGILANHLQALITSHILHKQEIQQTSATTFHSIQPSPSIYQTILDAHVWSSHPTAHTLSHVPPNHFQQSSAPPGPHSNRVWLSVVVPKMVLCSCLCVCVCVCSWACAIPRGSLECHYVLLQAEWYSLISLLSPAHQSALISYKIYFIAVSSF